MSASHRYRAAITLAVLASCSASPHRRQPESLALAIAYSGQEIWIGNDDVEPDPHARAPGALKQLARAIDRLELSRRGPRDVGVLVSYGTEVRLVVPTGPIARITGAATGTQRDYAGNLGTALAGGVDVAMFELEKTTAARKVLIVIGDGTDTDAKRAGPELARYRQRATASGIAIHAIVYRSWVSTPTSVIEALTPNIVEIQAVVDLPARLASIVQQCCR